MTTTILQMKVGDEWVDEVALLGTLDPGSTAELRVARRTTPDFLRWPDVVLAELTVTVIDKEVH